MKRLHITLLLFLLIISSLLQAQPVITFGEDTSEYPLGDYIMTAYKKGITINWHIKDNAIDIRIESDRNLSYRTLAYFYGPMLERYISELGRDSLKRIFTGGFFRIKSHREQAAVALLSAKNELYADYKQNYPNSQLSYLNDLFVELAHEAQVFAPLEKLFAKYDLQLELQGVEKVFTAKVSDLTFGADLLGTGLQEDDRVMFDAGAFYFSVTSP